jgi:AraC-like DNA-binding protein
MDAGFAALLRMCDFITADPVRPERVVLPEYVDGRGVDYEGVIGCAVEFGDTEIWEFARNAVEARLPGSIPEVASAVEAIADGYLSSLDEGAVAHEVREILIQTMPSGKSDQDTVARRLYRSRSTLQRQLVAEGTSYRQILESTRRSLAETYLRSNDYSQAEVAFMLGFTDQSNFARAFRRWTGMTPGEYRKTA